MSKFDICLSCPTNSNEHLELHIQAGVFSYLFGYYFYILRVSREYASVSFATAYRMQIDHWNQFHAR